MPRERLRCGEPRICFAGPSGYIGNAHLGRPGMGSLVHAWMFRLDSRCLGNPI
jgi:hypothetical protein